MKTLFVTDLDGTLLGPDTRVSAASRAMLGQAVERGALVTVATARTPATVQPLLQQVPPSPGVPAIVMTGAALWDRQTQRFQTANLIPPTQAQLVAEAFDSEALRPFVYCLSPEGFINVYHPRQMSRREQAFYDERRRLPLKRFHLGQQPATLDRVALFFATGPVKMVERVCQRLRQTTQCAASWYMDIYDPSSALIDIYAPGVNKATAVRQLAQSLGAERTVVYGDNLNDIPMMQAADLSVAVGNALGAVKEAADIVIGPNTDDAVPRHILSLLDV